MNTAHELMTSRPVAVNSTARLRDAVQILCDLDVRHVPVINEQQKLVGMVSDRDLRRLTLPVLVDGEELDAVRDKLEAPISALLTGTPLSVGLDTTAHEIAAIMLNHKVGAVPVVDGDNRLVGIVSYVDLLLD